MGCVGAKGDIKSKPIEKQIPTQPITLKKDIPKQMKTGNQKNILPQQKESIVNAIEQTKPNTGSNINQEDKKSEKNNINKNNDIEEEIIEQSKKIEHSKASANQVLYITTSSEITKFDNTRKNSKGSISVNSDAAKTNVSVSKFQFERFELIDVHEMLYPFWFEKGKIYKFIVNGKIQINDETMDYKNIENNEEKLNKFPLGCLLARISIGNYFVVQTDKEFTSEHTGPLFLMGNVPKPLASDVLHKVVNLGKLSITVNAEKKDFNQIETLLGWKIHEINSNITNVIKSQENSESIYVQEIYKLINKLRMNPSKFAEQFFCKFLLYPEEDDIRRIALEVIEIIKRKTPLSVIKISKKCEKKSQAITKEVFNIAMFSDDLMDTIMLNMKNKRDVENKLETEFFFHEDLKNPLNSFLSMMIKKERLQFIETIFNSKYDNLGIFTNKNNSKSCEKDNENNNYLSVLTFQIEGFDES